jgi:hypothetical protein
MRKTYLLISETTKIEWHSFPLMRCFKRMQASYQYHLSGPLGRYDNEAKNGFARFDSSRSWDVSKPRCLDGLRWELGILSVKKMTRGCLWDYSVKHYPLKTFNMWLSIVMGCPKGANSLKCLGWLEVILLKLWGCQKRVSPKTTRVFST